jgi:hypothetical protein
MPISNPNGDLRKRDKQLLQEIFSTHSRLIIIFWRRQPKNRRNTSSFPVFPWHIICLTGFYIISAIMVWRRKNLFLVIFIAACLQMSCNTSANKENFENTDLYDLNNPTIINLPEQLDGISGITYYPKDTSVFAVIDEDGLLFKIPLKNPDKTRQWSFAHGGDYEDLILKDSTFYILADDGKVVKVNFVNDNIVKRKIKFDENSDDENEFETLYYDDSVKKMVLMCNSCEADNKQKVSSYKSRSSSNCKKNR